jgi:hypothetical protein
MTSNALMSVRVKRSLLPIMISSSKSLSHHAVIQLLRGSGLCKSCPRHVLGNRVWTSFQVSGHSLDRFDIAVRHWQDQATYCATGDTGQQGASLRVSVFAFAEMFV